MKSTITIDVEVDESKVPQNILWSAPGTTAGSLQKAKAMLLSLWDGEDKSALRIDVWVNEMMVDEMGDFYFQVLMGMAQTYENATHDEVMVEEIKSFAKRFLALFKAKQIKENG